MNTENLIDDEWVAIRNFPMTAGAATFTESTIEEKSKDFKVTWDDEKRLLSICYQGCKSVDKQNGNWKYSVLFGIESLVANHGRIKELVPQLEVEMPMMPAEPKGKLGFELLNNICKSWRTFSFAH